MGYKTDKRSSRVGTRNKCSSIKSSAVKLSWPALHGVKMGCGDSKGVRLSPSWEAAGAPPGAGGCVSAGAESPRAAAGPRGAAAPSARGNVLVVSLPLPAGPGASGDGKTTSEARHLPTPHHPALRGAVFVKPVVGRERRGGPGCFSPSRPAAGE